MVAFETLHNGGFSSVPHDGMAMAQQTRPQNNEGCSGCVRLV